METIKACWKEASVNFKNFVFIVSGRLWAPPAMLSPGKPFFFLCVCDFRVGCTKHQKIHWSCLETLCLFRMRSDILEAFQDMGLCILKWSVSVPHPCWCCAQECMFLRLTPGSHRPRCDTCCCSSPHLTRATWKCWPAAKPVSSSRAVIAGCHEPFFLAGNMRKYFCEELRN